jgi:ATP-dependent RNA helicase RhlE
LCPKTKQTLLFSATMPFKVEQLASTILKDPERIEVTPTSSAAKNVSQVLYYVPKQSKIELCLHLLRNTIEGNILIFRRTKFGVDKLHETLLNNDFTAERLHGDRSQIERQNALADFKRGRVNILIATDVAARGIDINELDAVINFDLPNIPETYVHRIGRTGRAGEFGKSYSFCSTDEKPYVKAIQQLINVQIPIEENHPYPLDPKAQPIVHKKQGSKYKKSRKGEGSKKKKKRWY